MLFGCVISLSEMNSVLGRVWVFDGVGYGLGNTNKAGKDMSIFVQYLLIR